MTTNEKIKQLESQLAELKQEMAGKWQPDNAQPYYFVEGAGVVLVNTWLGEDSLDHGRQDLGNVFETKEKAEFHALRLKSMAQRWRPEDNEDYYYYDFNYKDITSGLWGDQQNDISLYFFGSVHPTREAAQLWYDTYGKAWEALL